MMALCGKLKNFKRQYLILNGTIICTECGKVIDTYKCSYVRNVETDVYYHPKCFNKIKKNLE